MSLHSRATSTVEHPGVGYTKVAHLQGRGLALARIGWVVYTLLVLGLFFANLPASFASLHTINPIFPAGPQLSPGDVQALQLHHLSLDFYAWLHVGLDLLTLLVYTSVGVVLFWRRSNDLVALLASITLIVFPLGQSVPILGPLVWPLFTDIVDFFGIICTGFFFYVFPNGQFAPPWMRWFMLGWTGFWAVAVFFPDIPPRSPLFALLFFGLIVSQIASQVYRYRRVSTLEQRQQTKWVIFGFALSFGSYTFMFALLYAILASTFHVALSPLGYFMGLLPFDLLLLLFPLSVLFAVLRSMCWWFSGLVRSCRFRAISFSRCWLPG